MMKALPERCSGSFKHLVRPRVPRALNNGSCTTHPRELQCACRAAVMVWRFGMRWYSMAKSGTGSDPGFLGWDYCCTPPPAIADTW